MNENNRLMILLNLERALSSDSIQNAAVRAEQYARQGAPTTGSELDSVVGAQPASKASKQPETPAQPEAEPTLTAS